MASIRKRPFSFLVYIFVGLLVILVPFIGDISIIGLVTRMFIMGLLAMSLDILVGYTGLWSFGHAAFFGLGAYTVGILIIKYGITSFWLTVPAGILTATLTACIFGFIALRVSGIYFLLVTFALGGLVYSLAVKLSTITGGTYGLSGIRLPGFCDSLRSFYFLVLVIVTICFIAAHFIEKSPFGKSLQGIQTAEDRMRILGYNTWLHKYIAFILAGFFAGVAGTMYAYLSGAVTPGSVAVTMSGMLWLMVLVGGIGTIWGSLIGSGVILTMQYFVSRMMPDRWPLILGICFVVVVFTARRGIWPYVNRVLGWRWRGGNRGLR